MPIQAPKPNGISVGSAVFAQLNADCPYTLQWTALPRLGSSTTWFLGPTGVLNPNGISIGSAVFAGLTTVSDRWTERLTDRATRCVTIGRIYVHSTAMRPNDTRELKDSEHV